MAALKIPSDFLIDKDVLISSTEAEFFIEAAETLRIERAGFSGIGSRVRFELQQSPIPAIFAVFSLSETMSRETRV